MRSSSDSQSGSGSPFSEQDVKMTDAPAMNYRPIPVSFTPSPAPIPRSQSPNRVLATQSQVNVVVKVEEADDSPSGNSAKKRRRNDDDDVSEAIPEEIAAVFLKRDQLLTISSLEHEAFVQRLANTRDLTDAELKEVKRQRRLIKNREYAQTSRQKKKVTMGHVKEQVGSLEHENEALKAELAELRARVAELELENASLCMRLSKDQTSSEDNSYDAVVEVQPRMKTAPSRSNMFGYRPAMAASSVLFVFLFAFGFLFNSPLFSSSSSGLPGGSRVGPVQHTGRALLEVDTAFVPYDPLGLPADAGVAPSDPVMTLVNLTAEVVNACVNGAGSC